ncbi:hypothetical protein FRC04_004490 [Tulasnella sp. 424]|nr:hypothetical protein FRC04_004490 [Tulasnella sp. 424]KAG8976559.1 hypothetical protein FRC05_003398 [Tulasnella sp. 425]
MPKCIGSGTCGLRPGLHQIPNADPTALLGPYNPPQGAGVTVCRCNTVVYSLLSACSYCQGGIVGKWSDWIAFCPSTYVSNNFPQTVPSDTAVPGWADLDPTAAGIWNPTAAQQYATTGSSGNSTVTPVPSASGGKKTNVGAIVGGVIGGIALLAAIGFLVWFLMRRSSYGKGQKVTPAPYADPGLGDPSYAPGAQGYEKEAYPPHRLDMGTPAPSAPLMAGGPMKPYDPADPSTFPTSPSYAGSPGPDSTLVSHDTGMHSASYQSYPPQQQGYPPRNNAQYQPGAYSGAAEV